jgi:PAS domain S-box-containing protein
MSDDALIEFRPIDRAAHLLLVVDDDPATRYATSRLLRSAGFRTREAATGAEGLAAADEAISAMVLDVHLPDIDGFALCRILRSRPGTSRLPVLHLSAAYVTDDDKVRGLDAGADAYLTHPVEPAVLVATVQALVRTRAAEESMRRSESKFRTIYAQAPGGICLLDPQGSLLDANPALLGFLGLDLDAVLGHPLAEFVPADEAARADIFFRRPGTDAASSEIALLDRAGRATHLEWSITQGVEPGVTMAVAVDISARRLVEQRRQELLEGERVARGAAERLSRMKDELIAVLSHELRTPLSAIIGWTGVLQKLGGNPDTIRALEAIDRNGGVLARMISDIFDMSRLNTGKMPLALELTDPAEAVIAAVNAIRPSIDENRTNIVVDLQRPHRLIRADSSRLQQIVWNLLSNAIKFSPEGGPVRITLRDVQNGITLAIADEGEGIEPSFLPFLFDRFTQSDAGANRLRGGLGLGLSIVKHLVEAHGGTVAAHSDGPGRGARFEVWLPVEPALNRGSAQDGLAMAEEGVTGGEHDGSLAGLHLLVVDDEPDACAMMTVILADRGAVVTATKSYDEALQVLGRIGPDLLISDIGMPGKDGYDLIREVRRLEELSGRHLPAIALTSFNRARDVQQALLAGFDLHVDKPLRSMKLVQSILALVRKPASSAATAEPPR